MSHSVQPFAHVHCTYTAAVARYAPHHMNTHPPRTMQRTASWGGELATTGDTRTRKDYVAFSHFCSSVFFFFEKSIESVQRHSPRGRTHSVELQRHDDGNDMEASSHTESAHFRAKCCLPAWHWLGRCFNFFPVRHYASAQGFRGNAKFLPRSPYFCRNVEKPLLFLGFCFVVLFGKTSMADGGLLSSMGNHVFTEMMKSVANAYDTFRRP